MCEGTDYEFKLCSNYTRDYFKSFVTMVFSLALLSSVAQFLPQVLASHEDLTFFSPETCMFVSWSNSNSFFILGSSRPLGDTILRLFLKETKLVVGVITKRPHKGFIINNLLV
jgi:hypothetical protein